MLRKAFINQLISRNDICQWSPRRSLSIVVEIKIVPKDCWQKANTLCPQETISSGPRRRLNDSAKLSTMLCDADVDKLLCFDAKVRSWFFPGFIHSPSWVMARPLVIDSEIPRRHGQTPRLGDASLLSTTRLSTTAKRQQHRRPSLSLFLSSLLSRWDYLPQQQ